MNLNRFVRDIEAPEPPYVCEVAFFPVATVPWALGALETRVLRYVWKTADDWRLGCQLIRELQVSLLMGCKNEITNRQDALYALLDRAINGTAYGVSGLGTDVEPYVWIPALPVAPLLQFDLPGLLKQVQTSGRQLDNLTNGTVYDEAPDTRNIRQQLDDLIAATGGQGLDDEQLAELVKIAALLA